MSRIKIFNVNYLIHPASPYRLWRVAPSFTAYKPWIVSGAGNTATFPTHAEAIAHADQLARAIREVP